MLLLLRRLLRLGIRQINIEDWRIAKVIQF